jgi:phenylacetate-CoA ligase
MRQRQHWHQTRLTEYQNNHLSYIVKYAYENVPFYHDLLKNIHVRPEDIKTPEDLKKLPILQKKTVRDNITRMISRKLSPWSLKKASTSGSTGLPLTIYLSEKEDEFRKAKHLRANIALGQKMRDRWVAITGPQHFSEITGFQRLLNVYAVIPVSVFDSVAEQAKEVKYLHPDILDGYSSSLFLLAKEIERNRMELVDLKFVIGGSELIDDSQRKYVERVFGVPFFDQYACVELERLAWQCRERNGYHIDADSVVMEFVDENGEAVGPGETGEIVCTSLFNYAMPFIRYSTGDVGRPSRVEKCNCGITFPKMELVEGRKDSLIVLPGGRVLSPHVLCLMMEHYKFYSDVDHYRIIQKREDLIQIYVKMRVDDTDKEIAADELVRYFRRALSIGSGEAVLEVKFVDNIVHDKSGKLATVVSELKQS